jgi:uncharacterized membrane protein
MISYLILFHAVLGGLALAGGLTALIVKKGSSLHKLAGKVFFWCMLVGVLASLVICWLPDHENVFLFVIGIFSLYMILSGYRALGYVKRGLQATDWAIAWSMMITAVAMLVIALLQGGNAMVLLLIFGFLSFFMSFGDLRIFRNPEKLRSSWLKLHVSKMIGGYIAATTAFVVVNGVIPGIYGWLAPGIVGSFFITFWMRKLTPASKK